MEYGANILSKQLADWQITNGSASAGSITLNANSTATMKILPFDLRTVPETMKMYLITSPFTDIYSPGAYAGLKIITEDGRVIVYKVPIIDTENGVCSVIIPTVQTAYKELYFFITSQHHIVINDWSLSAPIADESEAKLDELKEEIPKLLADYNTATMKVYQEEFIIALISARLIENTDVSGHLQITVTASEACGVTIR